MYQGLRVSAFFSGSNVISRLTGCTVSGFVPTFAPDGLGGNGCASVLEGNRCGRLGGGGGAVFRCGTARVPPMRITPEGETSSCAAEGFGGANVGGGAMTRLGCGWSKPVPFWNI